MKTAKTITVTAFLIVGILSLIHNLNPNMMITFTQLIITVIVSAALYTACEMIYLNYKRNKSN